MKCLDQIYQRIRRQVLEYSVGVPLTKTDGVYLLVNRDIDAPTGFFAAGRMWEEIKR